MAEFIGYESNRGNIVDFGAAASGLTAAIKGVDQKRQDRRAENEKIFQDTQATISTPVNTERKTLQDFVVSSADTGRTKLKELYDQMKRGDISRSQFKAASANINKSWGDLAGIVKTIDQRMAEAEKRQELGENGVPVGSEIEVSLNEKIARLADFNKLGIDIDSNGVMKAKYAGDGGDEYYEISSLLAPGNAKFDRADLGGLVGAAVKNWEERSKKNITDIRLAGDEWTEAKERVKNQIVSNPRTAASILVDGSGTGKYKVAIGPEDRLRAIEQFKLDFPNENPEDYIIDMQQDAGGVFQPALNQKQIEAARALVDNEIEMNFGRKEDYPEIRSYGGGGGGLTDNQRRSQQDEIETAYQGYLATAKAIVDGDYSRLQLPDDLVVFKGGKGRLAIYRRDDMSIGSAKTGYRMVPRDGITPVKTFDTPQALAEYAFKGDSNDALRLWNLGRQEYQSRHGSVYQGRGSSQGSKPSGGAPR